MSGWIWGVDPKTTRIALCCVRGEERVVTSRDYTVKTRNTGKRLYGVHTETKNLGMAWAASNRPEAIYVESPVQYGRTGEAMNFFATGVIISALAFYAPVYTIAPSSWKKVAIGQGDATKARIVHWARELGLNPSNQDEADAVGIAVAGWRIVHAPKQEEMVT